MHLGLEVTCLQLNLNSITSFTSCYGLNSRNRVVSDAWRSVLVFAVFALGRMSWSKIKVLRPVILDLMLNLGSRELFSLRID